LKIEPQACLEFAAKHTWEASARAFVDQMADIRDVGPDDSTVPFEPKQPRFVA
jgi:hypothetical protein